MSGTFSMVRLIERKKLGGELTEDELHWLCRGYLSGEIPDYQMAAWLMAVRFQGMTAVETRAFTTGLIATGETLEWELDRPVVDKHSTGGVGDKTSLVLVPLLASLGLAFVKMSGRGLGFTGGTVDKLESIPGYRVGLTLEEIRSQVARIGCAMVGQSPSLVPGDGAIYALRDVTSTVDSLPLIASSVMSKKLAAGARAIVLDVKYGTGALMGGREEAEALAREMVAIGEGSGRKVGIVLTETNEPLGAAVGNALEVREAIETLRGEGPEDLRALTIALGARLMVLAGGVSDEAEGATVMSGALGEGRGVETFGLLIHEQGGDARVVDDPSRLPAAPIVEMVTSEVSGDIERFDARGVAEAALDLGAGRREKGDEIDPRTGVRILVRGGERIERGQPIAEIHAATRNGAEAASATLRRALMVRRE